MKSRFEPIPGLWRFHLIYLAVTLILGWSFFPYDTYLSFLFIAIACLIGLIAGWLERFMASHILALVIGLVTPATVFIRMNWLLTVACFFVLSVIAYIWRKTLF